MTDHNEVTKGYSNFFKSWQAKQLGPKPTGEQLLNVHRLGLRQGKQALACAMSLRDCGVTNGQIVIACGAPQLNRMRGLVTDRLFERTPMPQTAESHMVYKHVITPKGMQRINRAAANEAKAVQEAAAVPTSEPVAAKPAKAKAKAKRASKPRKGAVTVVEVPAGLTPADLSHTAQAADLPVDVATGEPEATANVQ